MSIASKPKQTKLQRIINQHLVELIPIYSDPKPRRPPYSYFLDASVLRRAYSALLSPDMLTWHLTTSRFSRDMARKHGRELMRRVVPIARCDYTDEEIRLIKYQLHFQLVLGLEVVVMFVDPDFLPETEFGTDNFVLVKDRIRITASRPYDADVPAELELVFSPTTIKPSLRTSFPISRGVTGGCFTRFNLAVVPSPGRHSIFPSGMSIISSLAPWEETTRW